MAEARSLTHRDVRPQALRRSNKDLACLSVSLSLQVRVGHSLA